MKPVEKIIAIGVLSKLGDSIFGGHPESARSLLLYALSNPFVWVN
jgi:hypothetical protein